MKSIKDSLVFFYFEFDIKYFPCFIMLFIIAYNVYLKCTKYFYIFFYLSKKKSLDLKFTCFDGSR